MNQLSVFGNTVLTMSSREIATLCDKRHADVKRDIEVLANQLEIDVSKFAYIYSDSMNRQQTEYRLDKDTCLCLVTGYSAKLRMAIIQRWQELEQANQTKLPQALPDFTNPAVAARAWAEQFEQREKAERNLAIAGGALIRLGASDGSMCLRAAAKCLGMRQMDFINWCLRKGYLFRDGQGKLEAYAVHTSNGWFEHKADEANGHTYKQVLVTPKGLAKLAQKLEVLSD